MKKILFATTALVATAGIASAEVTLSGQAEMGIFNSGYDLANREENDDTQFFTDLDVTFTMTGEADNGLTFGATIDLDEAADYNNPGRFERPGDQGGENMFVSYGGATLTMGDTDGALDARVPEMALAGGSLADDE
ncbi:MAG: porin, partial [Rhodobacteraceae bacterium]|nr:porin [Paracoccaceae bacterium]